MRRTSPSTRIIGGRPADRCRSDALFLTENASSSAISMRRASAPRSNLSHRRSRSPPARQYARLTRSIARQCRPRSLARAQHARPVTHGLQSARESRPHGRPASAAAAGGVARRQPAAAVARARRARASARSARTTCRKRGARHASSAGLALEWHLIGHAAVEQVPRRGRSISTGCSRVDRAKLVAPLGRASARRTAPPLNVLVQVNIDDEASKSGCAPGRRRRRCARRSPRSRGCACAA